MYKKYHPTGASKRNNRPAFIVAQPRQICKQDAWYSDAGTPINGISMDKQKKETKRPAQSRKVFHSAFSY